MENATKALIIAGGMLIAMLIVGLLTWGYTQIRSLQQRNVEEEERQQIVDFNERFEAYNKKVVRGYQMISLSNLVYDTNTNAYIYFWYSNNSILYSILFDFTISCI